MIEDLSQEARDDAEGTASSTGGAVHRPLNTTSLSQSGRAKPFTEKAIELFLASCGYLSVFVTAGILLTLASETLAFFREVSILDFIGDTEWTPLFADKHFGIWPLVCGTAITAFIAVSVALPFGLMAAIYLSEFASPNGRKWLKPAIEVLAGVPTIVYGFFALIVVTPVLQKFVPGLAGFNALSPGIVMGIMIIPMISSLSEDAIYAVPDHLREAAYGLGADKVSTIFRVVLPSAFSGITASILLAVSRAIGETMIVAIAAGQMAKFTLDPTGPVQTMTAFIVQVSMGDTPADSLEYRTIFAVASALFIFTFCINAYSQRMAQRFRDMGYS